MTARTFAPGFRCSLLDVVVLIAGAVTTVATIPIDGRIAFVIGFTVAHFFLFCNVFRISRPLELVWATVFVALCYASFARGQPPWNATTGLSFVVTTIVITLAMRRPSYHGIGWQTINPRLPEWWEAQNFLREGEAPAEPRSTTR
ncbi:MAG TPA: hypothetical protein VFG20_20545 [Planctomycetaceae bacterium]|nr:hypothetical protein [Planctomycetaceae bacterium]